MRKIYDAPFALEWIEKIREEKRFSNIGALRRQIEEDIKRAKQILKSIAGSMGTDVVVLFNFVFQVY